MKAKWWVCTKPPEQGGEKIAGPFLDSETAIRERNRIEREQGREDLWVHEEL